MVAYHHQHHDFHHHVNEWDGTASIFVFHGHDGGSDEHEHDFTTPIHTRETA